MRARFLGLELKNYSSYICEQKFSLTIVLDKRRKLN